MRKLSPRRAVFSCLVPLLASACAVGPDYRKPGLPQTSAGAFVTRVEGTDPVSEVPADWWRLYNDPALNGLVKQALSANTDLRVASANLKKAQAVLGEARAVRLPSIGLSGGASYGNAVPGEAGIAQGGNGDGQLTGFAGGSLSWEVDLFGRVGRAIQAARADAEAVEAARDAVRVTVAAETTRAYLDACSYAFALDIARQSYKTSSDSLALVQVLERAGSLGKFDVERSAAAAATARSAIPALAGQRQVALFELAALLGTTPSDVPEAAQSCTKPPAPVSALPVGDGAALLRRRPDLREAERTLAADTARIGVATADLYPRISLGASGGYASSTGSGGASGFSFSLGPLISWSFPNTAVARSRVRQAEAQGEAALATFDGRVVTALKEVEQALAGVAAEQDRYNALAEAERRSQQAYDFARLRYRSGSVSNLAVLVAQADLLATRSSYAASLQRLSSARVSLFKALGGGWQQDAQATASIRPSTAGTQQ